MPQFRGARPPGPPANPDDWRPQQFGRGRRSSAETLVEPGWDGVRVIARFENGRSRFSDEDGVIEQSERIRATPYVREPFGSYLVSWRGLGFQRLFFKAANSRYLPNARNDAWSAHPMPVK